MTGKLPMETNRWAVWSHKHQFLVVLLVCVPFGIASGIVRRYTQTLWVDLVAEGFVILTLLAVRWLTRTYPFHGNRETQPTAMSPTSRRMQ